MKIKDKILGSTERERTENIASDTYQIKEFEGMIWLTFNSALICPMDMFKEEPITVLKEIRKLYVERHSK